MAREKPTIEDNKLEYFRNKLTREVSNLFKWEGLPEEIPVDYLEHSLILGGRVMFFYDEQAYGYMALKCTTKGFNLYDEPTEATTNVQSDNTNHSLSYTRNIIHKYDENIGKEKACVLINNMYKGESLYEIIDHHARRLALVQQAFDTNALWQNIPVIFGVSDRSLKQSVEAMFNKIMTGEPWIFEDKALMQKDVAVQAEPIDVPFILDKLYDTKNEIYNEFKQTIGLNSSGADKKERLLVDEVNSNNQSTETCLEIMLRQRKIACDEINKVFPDLNVTVTTIFGKEELKEEENEGGEENGENNNGIETPLGDNE